MNNVGNSSLTIEEMLDEQINDTYEVEEILESRFMVDGCGRKEEKFLVKWKGYDDQTWEPKCNLVDCRQKLNNFKRRNQNLPSSGPSSSSAQPRRKITPKKNIEPNRPSLEGKRTRKESPTKKQPRKTKPNNQNVESAASGTPTNKKSTPYRVVPASTDPKPGQKRNKLHTTPAVPRKKPKTINQQSNGDSTTGENEADAPSTSGVVHASLPRSMNHQQQQKLQPSSELALALPSPQPTVAAEGNEIIDLTLDDDDDDTNYCPTPEPRHERAGASTSEDAPSAGPSSFSTERKELPSILPKEIPESKKKTRAKTPPPVAKRTGGRMSGRTSLPKPASRTSLPKPTSRTSLPKPTSLTSLPKPASRTSLPKSGARTKSASRQVENRRGKGKISNHFKKKVENEGAVVEGAELNNQSTVVEGGATNNESDNIVEVVHKKKEPAVLQFTSYEGKCTTIEYQNAENLNAFTEEALQELIKNFKEAEKNEKCFLIVLRTSKSPPHESIDVPFCAGVDIGKWLSSHSYPHVVPVNMVMDPQNIDPQAIHPIYPQEMFTTQDKQEIRHRVKSFAKTIREFVTCLAFSKKILMAQVHGPASMLGCVMLAYFDHVYASDEATFSTPFIKTELANEGAAAYIFKKKMSHNACLDLLSKGYVYSVDDAKSAGLINQYCQLGELDGFVNTVVDDLVHQNVKLQLQQKEAIGRHDFDEFKKVLDLEEQQIEETWLDLVLKTNCGQHSLTTSSVDIYLRPESSRHRYVTSGQNARKMGNIVHLLQVQRPRLRSGCAK